MSQSSPEEGRKRVRFANVRAPKPVLGRETMERLTPRQLQIFEELEQLVQNEKITDLTMSQIASKLGCSLRTLYGISPSKDELVLAAADRNLRRVGRFAVLSETRRLDGAAVYFDDLDLDAFLREHGEPKHDGKGDNHRGSDPALRVAFALVLRI